MPSRSEQPRSIAAREYTKKIGQLSRHLGSIYITRLDGRDKEDRPPPPPFRFQLFRSHLLVQYHRPTCSYIYSCGDIFLLLLLIACPSTTPCDCHEIPPYDSRLTHPLTHTHSLTNIQSQFPLLLQNSIDRTRFSNAGARRATEISPLRECRALFSGPSPLP